jgi:hypothetical protein
MQIDSQARLATSRLKMHPISIGCTSLYGFDNATRKGLKEKMAWLHPEHHILYCSQVDRRPM